MQTAELIFMFKTIIGILVGAIIVLLLFYFLGDIKKKEKKEQIIESNEDDKEKSKIQEYGKFQGELTKESIYEFMEFDEIKDGMIIRKNRNNYVMVLQCNGVNYDLMSEVEKISVEEGFVQFLNTLKFPIQLYVQSRTLNLKEIVTEYSNRIATLENEILKLDAKLAQAKASENRALIEKIELEKRRKVNVLEYGMDITDYIGKISSNRNILQQKTYVIVTYYAAELTGNLSNYSKDEIDSMCFTELYTRCQNVASALAASQVNSKILDSEELSELLYIAYNRDEAEVYQLSKALDAQYDALYSTSKDVYKKQKEMIDKEIGFKAVEIATDSLVKADRMKKQMDWSEEDRKEKIRQKAKELLSEYEEQLDDTVYELAMENVDGIVEEKFSDENKEEKKEMPVKKKIIRKKSAEDKN